VFEKISELSQFQSSSFPASNIEFKYSTKSRFQDLCQFGRAPFLEDLPDLHTSSIQSFHADCCFVMRKDRNSSTPRYRFRLPSPQE
jgi:hypothetical protein